MFSAWPFAFLSAGNICGCHLERAYWMIDYWLNSNWLKFDSHESCRSGNSSNCVENLRLIETQLVQRWNLELMCQIETRDKCERTHSFYISDTPVSPIKRRKKSQLQAEWNKRTDNFYFYGVGVLLPLILDFHHERIQIISYLKFWIFVFCKNSFTQEMGSNGDR